MPTTNGNDRCPRCGALVLPEEKFCRQCGAELRAGDGPEPQISGNGSARAASGAAWSGGVPRTIDELQAFCDYNQMPLERMRFFVGVNYRQPRAFGIYRDGDKFVVYKNKDDGSRAVRYHGPDEAHAVKELYEKLLDECNKRNIWPGGKPPAEIAEQQRRKKRRKTALIVVVVALIAALYIWSIIDGHRMHRHDGYYRYDDAGVYYRYGNDWYYDDYYDDYYGWMLVNDFLYDDRGYDDYYLGDSYDAAWGVGDFRTSDAWESIQESEHTTSSDYNSWDSGDTDWSSDW